MAVSGALAGPFGLHGKPNAVAVCPPLRVKPLRVAALCEAEGKKESFSEIA